MKDKTRHLALRLSEEDLSTIRANADMLGMSVSAYVRGRTVLGMEKVLYDPEVRDCVFKAHKLFRESCSLISEQTKAARKNGCRDAGTVKALEEHMRDISSRLAAITDCLDGR